MKQKERLERLNQLADELQAAGNVRPYDPDNYNRIVDELNALWRTPADSAPSRAHPKPNLLSNWILRDLTRYLKKTFKKRVT